MSAIRAETGGLADRLRHATRTLHTQAERSGIMRTLLARRIARDDYCALLANLHAIYDALEKTLLVHANHTCIAAIVDPILFRRASIEADLSALHGSTWNDDIPIATATREYVAHIETISNGEVERVIAHAYVRYLGDLNGGQMLEPIVRAALDLHDTSATQFYRFDVPNVSAYASRYRAALDLLPMTSTHTDAIVDEACWAFRQHIALFEELAASSG